MRASLKRNFPRLLLSLGSPAGSFRERSLATVGMLVAGRTTRIRGAPRVPASTSGIRGGYGTPAAIPGATVIVILYINLPYFFTKGQVKVEPQKGPSSLDLETVKNGLAYSKSC